MTASQRVIPVEPLVATHRHDPTFTWDVPDPARVSDSWFYTDTEFAAHFMPAEPLEALLAAVEAHADSHGQFITRAGAAHCDLCAAYRAYVEAKR